jgi:hypothetical protein
MVSLCDKNERHKQKYLPTVPKSIEKSWKQRQNQYRKQNIFKISIANNILQHLQTPFLFH